jgi:hypothetical protein
LFVHAPELNDTMTGHPEEPGAHDLWAWVETLQLDGDAFRSLEVLANWLRCPTLPGLDLRGGHLDGPRLRQLFAEGRRTGELLESLVHLTCNFCQLGVGGVTILAALPLSALTTLRLEDNAVGDAGVRALATGTHWANLTTLNLRWNQVSDEGATALAAAALPRLTTLYLGHNLVRLAGATALLTSPSLPALRTLYLEHNLLADEEAAALRRRFGERVRF